MSARQWTLIGLFVALGISYLVFFTDWLRPAPILIAHQIRFAIHPPNYGRSLKRVVLPAKPGQTNPEVRLAEVVKSNRPAPPQQFDRIGRPAKGKFDPAPGGMANVPFSLDGWYRLTYIRVEDLPADGSAPKVLWEVKGKSLPLDSLLYGRNPEGMKQLVPPEGEVEPLVAGAPYRLFVAAGRRRGTNDFTTVALQLQE
jgi:hypothetical protein